MTVMIGVDPHKRSHTAVAIDGDDVELAAIEVRASARQIDELLGWAAGFADRAWAVEGAGGVGYLLAQQLVGAGERVLDVPATLAARVRVLGSGRSNKTDANDGYSIAVAARHASKLHQVAPADHASVLRLLAKRNKELGSARTRTACRLHALLVELVPGGIAKKITVNRAAAVLAEVTATNPVEATRHELALEHLEDLRRIDSQMHASKRRLADAVRASRTTVTEVFGFGPVGAAIAVGQVRDVSRFADRDHFAAYNGTAPIEVGSGGHSVHRLSRRGNRQLNHAIHIAAITQIRHAHSPGRAFYDRKLAEGKTKKGAIRALKRRISDALYQRLVADAAHAGPGGQTGTTEQASVTGLAPHKPALRNSHSRTHTEGRTRPAPAVTNQPTRRPKATPTRT
jgi:Transposase IS116/IS110/IS902 family./Transposase.